MKKRVITISILAALLVLGTVFFWITCDKGEGFGDNRVCTVKFKSYVDTEVPAQKVKANGLATDPSTSLERAGYTLEGWYKDDKKWDFAKDKVTENITLTAKWNRYLSFAEAEDNSGGIWVTGCTFDVENVIIPDTYNGKKVTGIHWGFTTRKNVKTIVIPDTVTYISEYSFNNCDALESIYLPDSVVTINEGAFSFCKSLKEIKCEATSKPDGWHQYFNKTQAKVTYGVKNQ